MPVIEPEALQTFVTDIFLGKGVPEEVAATVADSLVLGNLKGHDSHGFIRVIEYVNWIDRGWIRPEGELEIIKDTGTILIVDGHFQFGQVIGRQAAALAVERAKASGLCVLTIRRSSHLGRIGEFVELAAEAGIVSLALTNTHGGGVLAAPHGGSQARLSANPVAGGAPVPGRESLVMDMSTCVVAEGKVKVARAKGENLAPGCIVNNRGEPTTDPEDYYTDPKGAILPVAGHKGYALAIFADILAGAIGGGSCSREGVDRVANGWFAIFIDPAAFCGQEFYDEQVAGMVDWVKSSKTMSGFDEVLVPGEPESQAAVERQNGIPVEQATWDRVADIATELGVNLPL
ncbi:MAG: Ldh family oxidoreductase [Planctomycetota bacterium]|jgi:uncharacterized oxidoreductase|nr:Ldh family oxidoreductase [Planctomycetota bacterium]